MKNVQVEDELSVPIMNRPNKEERKKPKHEGEPFAVIEKSDGKHNF